MLLWVIGWASSLDSTVFTRTIGYLSIVDHLDSFSKGVLDTKDVFFLHEHDLPRPVPDRTGDGIDPVEGIMARSEAASAARQRLAKPVSVHHYRRRPSWAA